MFELIIKMLQLFALSPMFQHSTNYFNIIFSLNNIIFRSKSSWIFRYFGKTVLSMCVTTSHMSPMWLIQVPSRSETFLLYSKVFGEQMSIPRMTSWLQCLLTCVGPLLFCVTGWYLQWETIRSGRKTRAGKYCLL